MSLENPNNITRADWIAALRSGKYRQAYYRLKTEHGFCCLGVACDIAGGQWIGAEYRDCTLRLPAALQEDLGLDDKSQRALVSLNDTYLFSFSDIADLIEQGGKAILAARGRLQKERGY